MVESNQDNGKPPRPNLLQGRLVLAGAAVTFAGLLVCGGAATILLRDPIAPLTGEALEAAQVRWSENGSLSYNLDLQLGGARPASVHVEVRGGRVIDPPLIDGQPVRGKHTWRTWTVEGQFETMQRELELAADPSGQTGAGADTRVILRASFHPEYGYPLRFRRVVIGGLPEVSWEVVEMEFVERVSP